LLRARHADISPEDDTSINVRLRNGRAGTAQNPSNEKAPADGLCPKNETLNEGKIDEIPLKTVNHKGVSLNVA
jgi:hypothetical protein